MKKLACVFALAVTAALGGWIQDVVGITTNSGNTATVTLDSRFASFASVDGIHVFQAAPSTNSNTVVLNYRHKSRKAGYDFLTTNSTGDVAIYLGGIGLVVGEGDVLVISNGLGAASAVINFKTE